MIYLVQMWTKSYEKQKWQGGAFNFQFRRNEFYEMNRNLNRTLLETEITSKTEVHG